jgi:hypothetical protein
MKTRFIFAAIIALALASTDSFSQIKIVSGKVGIGQDPPAEKLHINGYVRGNQSGALRINTGNGNMDAGPKNTSFAHFYTDRTRYYFDEKIIIRDGRLSSYNASDLVLCTNNGAARIYIKSDGKVGIGEYQPDYKLEVLGNVGASAFITTSDERLKTEIKPLESSIDKIIKLNPISFKYSAEEFKLKKSIEAKENTDISDSIYIELDSVDLAFCNNTKFGFSAQEIQEVYPELVIADTYGYLSIDYNGIIPILVNAIKEQQELITRLSERLAKLEEIKR